MLAAAAPFWLPDADSLAHLAPMWVLIGTIVTVLLGAMVVGRRALPIAGIALIGAVLTGASCFWVFDRVADGAWTGLSPGQRAPMLLADNFSMFFGVLVSAFLAAVIGLWICGAGVTDNRADMHRNAPEFFVLLLGSALGMLLMVSTTNLLMIVIAIELASLPSYGLAAFDKRSRVGAEAGIKYVLFGGVTSAIMIYGVSLLYGLYGTLDVSAIAGQLARGEPSLLAAIALFAVTVGIGFKISAVPFHYWCPDVFEGAAIEVTTWLSVASKAAGLGLLLRILGIIAQAGAGTAFTAYASLAVGIFATLTCTVANLAALHQTNIKRLLAYSSIAHAGYMLMAAAIFTRVNTADSHPAFAPLAVYLIVYLFMNLGAFGCAAMVSWATGSETLDGYAGLGRRQPWVALLMSVCLFSLVGLPPLGGFVAKIWLLYGVWGAGLKWLVVVAVINTAISLYYYAKVARAMWLTPDQRPAFSAPVAGLALASLSVIVVLLTGTVAINPLLQRADALTKNLYLGTPGTAEVTANAGD